MALVPLKCPVCAGTIEIDDSDTGVCIYCGVSIMITEKVRQRMEIDQSKAVDNWMVLARAAIESKDLSKAKDYADRILATGERNAEAWLMMGHIHQMNGDFISAGIFWDLVIASTEGAELALSLKSMTEYIVENNNLETWTGPKRDPFIEFGIKYLMTIKDLFPETRDEVQSAIDSFEEFRASWTSSGGPAAKPPDIDKDELLSMDAPKRKRGIFKRK